MDDQASRQDLIQTGLSHGAETAKHAEKQSIPKAYEQHRAELLRQFDARQGIYHEGRALPQWIERLLKDGAEDA